MFYRLSSQLNAIVIILSMENTLYTNLHALLCFTKSAIDMGLSICLFQVKVKQESVLWPYTGN